MLFVVELSRAAWSSGRPLAQLWATKTLSLRLQSASCQPFPPPTCPAFQLPFGAGPLKSNRLGRASRVTSTKSSNRPARASSFRPKLWGKISIFTAHHDVFCALYSPPQFLLVNRGANFAASLKLELDGRGRKLALMLSCWRHFPLAPDDLIQFSNALFSFSLARAQPQLSGSYFSI